jgi:uncharacterized protein YbaR (Trm112 family)
MAREVAAGHREAARHTPRPPFSGLVVEIGAGQSPHPRADLVVDKYLADNFERPGEADLDFSKPLLIADGHRLPLADKSMAYSIALHVLEHATDPVLFAAELSRVSAGGFVQVPSREAELTFGWPYHPWLIDRVDDTLVFTPRNGLKAPVGEVFHRGYAESALLRNWWAASRSRWHHSVEWRDSLSVEVNGTSSAEQTASFDVERTLDTLRSLSQHGALPPLPTHLRAALRCPSCHDELTESARGLKCASCGRSYPAVGPVPLLLEAAAEPSA